MPLKRVIVGEKVGYCWNDGKIHFYIKGNTKSRNSAKRRALADGQAIKNSKKKRKRNEIN